MSGRAQHGLSNTIAISLINRFPKKLLTLLEVTVAFTNKYSNTQILQVKATSVKLKSNSATASMDFNFTSMELIGICGGSPGATPLKFTLVILKSNSASASLDFKMTTVDFSPSR